MHFQGAVGVELWSMSDDIVFDNFIITDSKSVADIWATDTWEVKHLQEMSGGPSAVSATARAGYNLVCEICGWFRVRQY